MIPAKPVLAATMTQSINTIQQEMDGPPPQYTLIGSPRQIKLWKEIYGQSVEYVETEPLKTNGYKNEST